MGVLRDKMSYKELLEEIEKIKFDAQAIKTATDYNDEYIKHGSKCDSSDRRAFRLFYVKEAEKIIINENKARILELASKLILEEN